MAKNNELPQQQQITTRDENETIRQVLVSTGSQRVSDVDRSYFRVLNIIIMRNVSAAFPPDVGVHLEAELDAAFAYSRLANAASHFVYFKCIRPPPVRARLLLKYVNAEKLPPKLGSHILESVKKEMSLLKYLHDKTNSCRKPVSVMQCYFALARQDHVSYLFFERPSETLEELLRRVSVEEIKFHSKVARSQQRKRLMPRDACYIMKSIATPLALMHQEGIVHGSLCTNSVFVFHKPQNCSQLKHSSAQSQLEDLVSLKLGNFYFANMFDHSSEVSNEDAFFEELVKARELNALYATSERVKTATQFNTSNEEQRYLKVASVLVSKEVSSESMLVVSEDRITRFRNKLDVNTAISPCLEGGNSGTILPALTTENMCPPVLSCKIRLDTFIDTISRLY